jgi:hypothetical protein
MECGLNEAALPEVEFTFAREQTFAEKHASALEHPALDEVVLLSYEDLSDQIRVVYEIGALPKQLELREVAVVERQAGKEADGIAAEGRKVA